jgi:hypothetical protein
MAVMSSPSMLREIVNVRSLASSLTKSSTGIG